MSGSLQYVSKITASKTEDLKLATDPRGVYDPAELVAYLNESPKHALVLHDLEEEGVVLTADGPVYVCRGAGGDLRNFYYGKYPAENRAPDGGDLNAEDALAMALDLLCY